MSHILTLWKEMGDSQRVEFADSLIEWLTRGKERAQERLKED
jgi:hypothetical protein